MSLLNSHAVALRNFFNRISSGPDKAIGAVVAESFGVGEHSFEFYSLMLSQTRNFDILRRQIEASEIRTGAKGGYLGQLNTLSNITRYDHWPAKFHQYRQQHIAPNVMVLTYLEDAIQVAPELKPETVEELQKLAKKLQELRAELNDGGLPVQIRTELEQQLDELIFSLKHYECIGADSVWRQASATTATIYKEASVAATRPKVQTFLGRLVVVLTLIGAAVTEIDEILGHVVSIADRSATIADRLKSGYKMIEGWKPTPPLIEYKPNADDQAEI